MLIKLEVGEQPAVLQVQCLTPVWATSVYTAYDGLFYCDCLEGLTLLQNI